MIRWTEFEERNTELAAAGQERLFQFGPGLAFLGTIRRDGGPRLHPICPVLSDGGLYFFGLPKSPKLGVLLRDGRYALHCFPPPPEGQDEEFYCTGSVKIIEDPKIRSGVVTAALHKIHDDDICVEFLIDRVLRTTWQNWGTPEMSPIHEVWHA